MAGDKTYITDQQGKQHRATRVHAVTPTNIVWSSNPNDYAVQVLIDGKWHRAILTYDVSGASYFDNVNIDKALVVGADGKNHTALIVSSEAAVTLSSIKTDEHALVNGTTTGETAVCTYTEAWGNIEWEDNVNVYKVIVTGSDGKKHTALLTTGASGGVQAIVMGVAPLQLPNALATNVVSLIAFGGTEQRNLPDNYIQRDYIYMLAGAYLLTDIVPTYDGHYELDFQTTSIAASAYAILGGRTSGLPAGLQLARINTGWCVDGFGSRYEPSIALIADTRYKFTFDNQVAKLESEGSTVFNTTFTTSDATGAALCINGMNTNGTVSASPSGIYLYSFKAWDNQGNLVANYIPVVQQYPTAAGFYDTVSGTFKAATAGTFTAGPETVPTPDAPMDIVSNNGVLKVSPNLFDKDSTPYRAGFYISSATVGNSSFGTTHNDNYNIYRINIQPNTTYTFGIIKANAPYWVVMDDNTILDCAPNSGGVTGTTITITTPADAKYLYLSVSVNGTYKCDDVLQLELGSTATSYKPYSENKVYAAGPIETIAIKDAPYYDGGTATAEILLSVGNHTDEQEVISGGVTRNVGVLVLDGITAGAKIGTAWNSTYKRGSFAVSGMKSTASGVSDALSSHFEYNATVYGAPTVSGFCTNSGSVFICFLGLDSVTSADTANAWLAAQYAAGTPVIVIYPLATPTTNTVTPQPMQTAAGNNTAEITQASLDNLELEVTYMKQGA